jgi:hypothetical protein
MAEIQHNAQTSDVVEAAKALMSLKGTLTLSLSLVNNACGADVLYVKNLIYVNMVFLEPRGFDLNVRPASKDVSMVNSYLLEFDITSVSGVSLT